MKKIFQYLPQLLIIITFIYSLTHLQQINQITASTFLSVRQLFFSLFFLMLIFSVASEYGLFIHLGRLLAKPLAVVLRMNPVESSIYLASIFAGYPTFAKLIKDAYISKRISKESADRLLKISSHGSIGFIVLTLGNTLYHNLQIGWMVFFAQVLSNFIIALLWRPKTISPVNENNIQHDSLITVIKSQMLQCISVFVYIYGFMLVFNILCAMFFENQPLIHGLLEFSQGCLLLTGFSLKTTAVISSGLISFSSLSVIFQVSSVLDGLDLDFKGYVIARIFQSFLSMMIVYFLY